MSDEEQPVLPERREVAGPSTASATQGMGENTWAMLAHLGALSGLLFPVAGNIIGPLIPWILKKDEMPLVDRHGKEALNFQLSMLLYNVALSVVGFVLLVILIGFVILPVAWVCWYVMVIVFPILAGLKANEGGFYEYPLTIRFIK